MVSSSALLEHIADLDDCDVATAAYRAAVCTEN